MSAIASVGNSQSLGTDQFLKLFTKQVQMQNPMEPMNNTDFLAQLAQFSSVEQMSNLNASFEKLLGVQQALQAGSLVGKMVNYTDSSGTSGQGRVTGVRLTADGPVLMLGNKQVTISQVTSIEEPPPVVDTTAASGDSSTRNPDI